MVAKRNLSPPKKQNRATTAIYRGCTWVLRWSLWDTDDRSERGCTTDRSGHCPPQSRSFRAPAGMTTPARTPGRQVCSSAQVRGTGCRCCRRCGPDDLQCCRAPRCTPPDDHDQSNNKHVRLNEVSTVLYFINISFSAVYYQSRGMALWLGRRSLAGGLSLIYAWSFVEM